MVVAVVAVLLEEVVVVVVEVVEMVVGVVVVVVMCIYSTGESFLLWTAHHLSNWKESLAGIPCLYP